MALRSAAAAVDYRQSNGSLGVLAQRFGDGGGSVRAMLARSGPFAPDWQPKTSTEYGYSGNQLDSFRFTNRGGWDMSEEDAAALRQRAQQLFDVGKVYGIGQLRAALTVFSVPGFGGIPVGLQDVVINEVTGEFTNMLIDKIVAAIPADYGRCGGMAFAGLDYFLAGRDVSDETNQPATGPLRAFIWRRLLDSLEANAVTHVEWVTLLHIVPELSKLGSAALGAAAGSVGGPLGTAIGALIGHQSDLFGLGGADELCQPTRDNLAVLGGKLEQWPAWPIGLIYGNKPFLWQQHQVLVTGYRQSAPGMHTLTVWDNNWPGLRLDWVVDTNGDQIQVRGPSNDVKGIICEDYAFVSPP